MSSETATSAGTPAAAPAAPAPAPAANSHSLLKNFLSGGVGGMCLVLAGQPFDMVKVRMQTMPIVPGQKPLYTGAMDCTRQILAKEGFKGLYRGMSAPLMGVTPIFALCFWAYDLGKTLIKTHKGYTSDAQLSLVDIGAAGALSAVPTTLIMAPGERIKCILQVQDTAGAAARKFAGPGDVVKHLVKEQGVASVFRGSLATLLRDGSGSIAYFAVYEAIKRALTPAGQTSLSPTAVILGGGFAGVCNWLVALPFDVIKSRIQTADLRGPGAPRLGMWGTAKQVIAEGGVAGLYRGAGPALIRAFPANAACFMGMEVSMMALNKLL